MTIDFSMNYERQVLLLLICGVFSYVTIRVFISGIIGYLLNNSAEKKRKKGQTFKEWFLYSRYRDVVPKIYLILYFAIVIIHLLAFAVCTVLYFIPLFKGGYISTSVAIFDFLWILINSLMFWSLKPGLPYGRWIKKKRGMPPKRRK